MAQLFALPAEPALSGKQALVQALAGPSFWVPQDAAWTNCVLISVK